MEARCNGETTTTIAPVLRALANTHSRGQCQNVVAKALLALLIGLDCQGQSPKSSVTLPGSSPSSSAELDPASIVLELNRAVAILKQGMAESWGDRGRYLSAFEETPNVDSAGRSVTDAKSYVECVIERHLRKHEIWDEGVPIDAEARLTETDLINLKRYGQSTRPLTEFHPPPCISSEHRTIVLAAGVATAMLKKKINPTYPDYALQHGISGTVTLDAIIGIDGHVSKLTINSGPNELRQASLDAVSQWTYQPYQLNNRSVEVETTITVRFSLHR